MEIATFAGGCFWCTEAIFKRLKGVRNVIPGYSGGNTINPTYTQVCTGKTNHAEAIQITFDPIFISFQKLLDVFWRIHNPTTKNQQDADIGSQYRSAIFYHNKVQKELSEKSKDDLEKSGLYKQKIVTEIIPFRYFYPAEEEHIEYYDKNRLQPYCQIVIDPKIQKLYKDFKNYLK